MRRRVSASVIAVGLLWTVSGCAATTATRLFDPFGLFLSGQKPIRVGINRIHVPLPPRFPKAPWWELQTALTQATEQPVQFECLTPFQMRRHLEAGRLQFAFVTAGEYIDVADAPGVEVMAVGVNPAGRKQRSALVIASARSDIQTWADIKGQRFAFGPQNDSALHWAAVAALAREGIALDDVRKELVPIPGGLQFHISSREAAKAVVYEPGIDVGVVDELEYEAWPETGGKLLPLSFSRDQVRVLGRTEPVPEVAWLVSSSCDPQLADAVRDLLFRDAEEQSVILAPLGIQRFESGDKAPYEEFASLIKPILNLP